MTGKIISALILTFAGVIFSYFHPYYLPQAWVDSFVELGSMIWIWDGILPIDAFIEGFVWFVATFFWIFLFKFIVGIIALATGAGKPEL